MLLDASALLADFDNAAANLSLPGWPTRYEHEILLAPHRPKPLRPECGAVYLFALADHMRSAAGPGRVLKVGRVGTKSNARFQFQHYSPTSARSSLARSMISYPILWPWLGVDHLDASNVREWMLTNLDRINIYVPASSALVIPQLETYVRARVGSVTRVRRKAGRCRVRPTPRSGAGVRDQA